MIIGLWLNRQHRKHMSKQYNTVQESEKYFENVNGREIRLLVNRNSNDTKMAYNVEFMITEVMKENVKRKSVGVLLLVILNVVLLYTNVVNRAIILVVFIFISCNILWLMIKVKSEKLLIVKSLGIQYTVYYYMGSYATQFVPWEAVQKVFINEVITLQRVLFFLTVMTQQSENKTSALIPLFKHMKPRLKCLEIIYKHMEQIFS